MSSRRSQRRKLISSADDAEIRSATDAHAPPQRRASPLAAAAAGVGARRALVRRHGRLAAADPSSLAPLLRRRNSGRPRHRRLHRHVARRRRRLPVQPRHRRVRPQLQHDVQRPQHEHRVGPRAAANPQQHLFSRRLDRRPRGGRRRRPRLLRAARVRARAARPARDGERAPPQGAALLPLARYADSAILAPFGAIL